MAKFQSILETVGRTPVVRTAKLSPPGVDIWVKMEAFNPLGSVKDRLALGVIEDAERSGALQPGQTIIEATSGNTGIGLAMVCARKGYPLVVTMAESFSVERRKLMRFLGARVVLTPAKDRGTGMVNKARELAEKNGWFMTRQFENDANPAVHERTTGREIVEDFKGERLDYWVTGYGTGGTLTGVARVLKRERPDVKIIVSEPDVAALFTDGAGQPRRDDGSAAGSHKAWSPHPIQGWTPDFIPLVAQEAIDKRVIDKTLKVTGADAMLWSRRLAQEEGIFVGISAGATYATAMEVALASAQGSVILAMLPDTGERYMSTPLFADILPEMNDAEKSISEMTSGYRL
jgi:cysteine synthase A